MRTRVRGAAAAAAALLAAGVIAACGSDHSPSDASRVDAMFVSAMIPHHEDAVEMSKTALERSRRPEIRALARDIIASQNAEIASMRAMKDDLGADHGMMDDMGSMMGMSDAMMGMSGDPKALERADPFDRAFLDMMIPHHEGAIRMTRMLLRRGESPELQRMGRAIVTAQRREISQMRAWRTAWYGAGGATEPGRGMDPGDMMGSGGGRMMDGT